MLVMDQLRGKDSTGIFAVGRDGQASVTKSIATPTDFLQLSRVSSAIQGASVLVGHNRHATIGAVNSNNAHPFQHGNITLVHNGTLDKWPKLPHQDEFDTDSECVAYNLSLCANDADTVKFLEAIEGAFAFIWYDDVEEATYFIRNTERPLYRTTVSGSTYLASERGILFAALDRNSVKVPDLDVLQEIPTGILFKVSVVNGALETEETAVELKKSFANSWDYPRSSSGAYGNSNNAGNVLFTELGIKVNSVLRGFVEKIETFPNVQYGTVFVRLADKGFNSRVVVYGVQNVVNLYKTNDPVTVRVTWMDEFQFGNKSATSTYQMTARGTDIMKAPALLDDVVADEDDVPFTIEQIVTCLNCDDAVDRSKAVLLTSGEYCCNSCLKHDHTAAMYCQHLLA